MRFSLRLNNDLALAEYVQLAQAAEAAGFDQFWVSHDLFLRSAPVILSAVAVETKRIEIGSCILNPYTINPAELAMLAATLDEFSGCRFNLGLAAGAGNFLNWIGVEQSKPLATMRETIKAVRALLSGERVESGHFVNWTHDAYLRFKAPRVTPIYLGAMSPNMLRLAGELCDGVLPLLFPPEYYYTVWPLVQEGLAKRDRALGELDFAACFWASLDADPTTARKALAQKVAYYGQSFGPLILERLGLTMADFDPIQQALTVERDEAKALALVTDSMLAVGIVGGAEDLIARLEPLVQAGVRHLSFGPPLGPNPLAAVELLGREVLPYFRNLFPA
jgi:5,10-methylenetetrahydromethanopterin reductase